MLRVTYEGNFNPFDWEDFRCPYCGGESFISESHSSVHCEHCGCQFHVRPTAGDPGCVIDAIPPLRGSLYAPLWKCKECGFRAGFFDWQMPRCPEHGEEPMEHQEYIGVPINDIPSRRYCLILKIGDYCSGWMADEGAGADLSYPTQREWEEFQKNDLKNHHRFLDGGAS